MQVQEFMTRNFHAIQADDSCQHAAEQMRRHNVGALPIFSYDQLVGMITDRDLSPAAWPEATKRRRARYANT